MKRGDICIYAPEAQTHDDKFGSWTGLVAEVATFVEEVEPGWSKIRRINGKQEMVKSAYIFKANEYEYDPHYQRQERYR